jgi:hypothetical protein
MQMVHRDIVIINGQSGIKMEKCLNKIETHINCTKTLLDPVMTRIALEGEVISRDNFIDVLALPPRTQEDLWRKAFDEFTDRLPKIEEGKFHLLSFHACYYHPVKTEIDCPVDLEKLSKVKDRIKMVITLIDDCYDVYRRLMGQNQLYSEVLDKKKTRPESAIFQSVINLLRIISWREAETAFSRKISSFLDVPHYLVAVKHPTFMITRLIEKPADNIRILYLSHHISKLKSKYPGSRASSFPHELNTFIGRVLEEPHTVIFIPDTIDELRIEQALDGKLETKLSPGWPLPFENDQLHEPLSHILANINPLNPQNYEPGSKALKASISSVLEVLESTISEQINSRDRTLLEQSQDGIIVFRPYWIPEMSPGVSVELDYNSELQDGHRERRKAYILNTWEELGKMQIGNFFTVLKNTLNYNKERDSKLMDLCTSWQSNKDFILQFAHGEINREKVEEIILTTIGEMQLNFIAEVDNNKRSALKSAAILNDQKNIHKMWDTAFQQITEDSLVKYCDNTYIICSLAEFPSTCENFLKNNIFTAKL